MRSILLVLLCSTASLTSAQSLKFIDYKLNNLDVSGDTVLRHFGNYQDTSHQIQLKVLNTASSALDVHVIRYELDVTTGTKNYYCWTHCYEVVSAQAFPKFKNPIPFYHYYTIEEDSLSTITVDAYHKPEGNIGLNCYRYVAYNKEDPTDSVYTDICFNIGYVGMNEIKDVSLNLYPNPVGSILNLDISGLTRQAGLQIIDLGGRVVMTTGIIEGLNQIPTQSLPNGMYFLVVLDSNGHSRLTEKFIIAG